MAFFPLRISALLISALLLLPEYSMAQVLGGGHWMLLPDRDAGRDLDQKLGLTPTCNPVEGRAKIVAELADAKKAQDHPRWRAAARRQIASLLEMGDAKKAQALAEELTTHCTEKLGGDHLEVCTARAIEAVCFIADEESKKAIPVLRACLEEVGRKAKRGSAEEQFVMGAMLHASADDAEITPEFTALITRLQESVRQQPGELSVRMVEFNVNQSAYALIMKGEDCGERALKFAQAGLDLALKLPEADRASAVSAYLAVGAALHRLHRYAEAEESYRLALVECTKEGNDKSLWEPGARTLLAHSKTSIANVQYDKPRKAEAEQEARQALKLTQAQYGTHSPEAGNALINLGNALISNDKFIEAEKAMREATRLHDDAYGSKDPRRVEARMALVGSLVMLGRMKEAETLSEDTLLQAESALGREHRTVARALMVHGSLLIQLDRKIEAEQAFWEASTIYKTTRGPEHEDFADSLLQVAILCEARGDEKNPESMYRTVLAVREKKHGKNSVEVAEELLRLASFLAKLKRNEEAAGLLTRQIAINEAKLGKESVPLGDGYLELAKVQRAEHEFKDAETSLRKALEIHSKALGDTHLTTADTKLALAKTLLDVGKLEEGERIARESYIIFARITGANKPSEDFMRSLRDTYQLIIQDMKLSSAEVQERVRKLEEGEDPGPPGGVSGT